PQTAMGCPTEITLRPAIAAAASAGAATPMSLFEKCRFRRLSRSPSRSTNFGQFQPRGQRIRPCGARCLFGGQTAAGPPRWLTAPRTASRYCVSDKPVPTRLALLPFPVAKIDEIRVLARSEEHTSELQSLTNLV